MAIFGVFFSGGLVLAAGLAALGTQLDWRWSFGIAAVLAGLAAISLQFVPDLPQAQTGGPVFAGLAAVLGIPTAVGVIGGISQYATVSFLPIFAVDIWDTGEAAAAGILAVGRVLSVPAKLLSGQAADRYGPVKTARGVGVSLATLGLCWTLVPWMWLAGLAAVLFAAEVSALFPLANLLAFERVGSRGPALGAFRSLQLGAGAVAGVAIGAAADAIGLRPMVAFVSALPLLLILVRPAQAELTSR
jgi:MFS family permease